MFYKIQYIVYDNWAEESFVLSQTVFFSRKLYEEEKKDFRDLLDEAWKNPRNTLSRFLVQEALDKFHKRHPNVRGVIAVDPFDTITIRKEIN